MAAAAVAEAVPEAARSLAVASHLENRNIDKFAFFVIYHSIHIRFNHIYNIHFEIN